MARNKATADTIKDRNREITDLIESGRYYKDARDWYATVYLAPYTHRFWMFILASITVVGAFSIYILIDSMFPLSTQIPFSTKNHWKDQYYPRLNKLADSLENSNQMLATYFLKNYVRSQEEYTPPNFKGGEDANNWRLSRVEHQSKKRVYHDYLNRINPNNSDSPSQIYAHHTKRIVRFDDNLYPITLPKNFNPNDSVAVLRFTTKEIRGEEETSSTWEARISFSITDANLALKEKKPLRLYVSDYKVSKIRGSVAEKQKK